MNAALGIGECHVWWASTAEAQPGLITLLDPVERARVAGFRTPSDAVPYIVTHALARLVLASHLYLDAAEVRFTRECSRCGGPHGKPAAVGHPIEFSIAHSGRRAVVAVSYDGAVGMDIEEVTPQVTYHTLAAVVLSPPEQRHLARLKPPQRQHAFLTYWTRKEAVLKATGKGLATSPASVTVTAPTTPARLLSPLAERPIHLVDLKVSPRYVAALAIVTAKAPRIIVRDGRHLLAPCSG